MSGQLLARELGDWAVTAEKKFWVPLGSTAACNTACQGLGQCSHYRRMAQVDVDARFTVQLRKVGSSFFDQDSLRLPVLSPRRSDIGRRTIC